MAGEIKAYPEEYIGLKTDMDTLRGSITTALDDINTKLLYLVSSDGPFYSKAMSKKVINVQDYVGSEERKF